MRVRFLTSIFLLGVATICMAGKPKKVDISKFVECPESKYKTELLIEHTGFVLSYNEETNCPNWVAWELTDEEAYANVAPRSNEFQADPEVPLKHRVEWYSYKQSGYDRGHMCPAGDMKWSAEAMHDCFYMSNICPQARELNQKWWEHVERACRRWASQEGKIYICCGPIYKGSERYMGNEVKIRIPDGYFKVILSLKEGKEKAIGFIYANTDERQTMDDAATTVDEVEELTGLDFFPTLDKKLEKKIEAEYNLRKWN